MQTQIIQSQTQGPRILGVMPWAEAAQRLRAFVAETFRYVVPEGIDRDIASVKRGIANPFVLQGWDPIFAKARLGAQELARELKRQSESAQAQSTEASQSERERLAAQHRGSADQTKRRYLANRAARAEANRQRAKGSGAGIKGGGKKQK